MTRKIYWRSTGDLLEIYRRSTGDLPEIYRGSTGDLLEIYRKSFCLAEQRLKPKCMNRAFLKYLWMFVVIAYPLIHIIAFIYFLTH